MRTPRDLLSLGYRHSRAAAERLTGSSLRAVEGVRGRVLILMYHRVLGDHDRRASVDPAMFVRAATFERQLAWLRSRWQVRTLGEAIAAPPDDDDSPIAVITFDDGWRDNLLHAWPILERHRLGATLFVVTGWAAEGRTAAGEFIRPDELRQLAAAGMEIGAHTVSHPRLSGLAAPEAESEMRGAKDAIESWIDAACDVFAYPYGDHTDESAGIARQIFAGTVLNTGGWWRPGGDPARIPRIGLHEDVSSTGPLLASRVAHWARRPAG